MEKATRRFGRKPKPCKSASFVVRDLFNLADEKFVSNKQIAKKLKVMPTTVYRWRKGMSTPDAMNLEAFAKYLGGEVIFVMEES